MAMSSLRLRRAVAGFSTLHRSLAAASASPLASSASSSPSFCGSSPSVQPHSSSLILQSRAFRSSPSSLLAFRSSNVGGGHGDDEIGPDTILFEGCDYNHWLIVMDFPRDNKPSPEEMVRTYEETCAKGLNISIEEAKLKMYACSTTTYNGFQVVMTEEESEKFNGLPGVVFVLPDSYIDPQNKEYGGDKYENGKITHRPPPVQYGRPQNRRFSEQSRFDRSDSFNGPQGPRPYQPNQQPNSFGQQGRPMQGGGAPQTYPPPQQNYGPPPGARGGPPPPPPPPPYQGNYNQGQPGNFYPRDERSFVPPPPPPPPPPRQQGGFREDYGNYGGGGGGPQSRGGFGQGQSGFGQHQGQSGFGQGAGQHQGQSGFGQGAGQHQGQGGFGQGAGQHQDQGGFNQGAGQHQGQGRFGQGAQEHPVNYSPVNERGRY